MLLPRNVVNSYCWLSFTVNWVHILDGAYRKPYIRMYSINKALIRPKTPLDTRLDILYTYPSCHNKRIVNGAVRTSSSTSKSLVCCTTLFFHRADYLRAGLLSPSHLENERDTNPNHHLPQKARVRQREKIVKKIVKLVSAIAIKSKELQECTPPR